jgi:hypothetical protein
VVAVWSISVSCMRSPGCFRAMDGVPGHTSHTDPQMNCDATWDEGPGPRSDRPVVAGGSEPAAVRGDGQRVHPVGVAGEGVADLPGDGVPDPHPFGRPRRRRAR